jgi:hypothetical protein
MKCAEPRVVEVQLNTREVKNIVKLERTLTCTGKLTSVAQDKLRTSHRHIEALRQLLQNKRAGPAR